MLKTRITNQYGLKVPFSNAGMAFIATAPLYGAILAIGIPAVRNTRGDRPSW
jgi:hypothetical protein